MTTFETPEALRRRLRKTGLTYEAIDAAWPEWWSEAAIGSTSAEAELRFSLARHLGLSPSALVAEAEPTFMWSDRARFKRLSSTAPEQFVLSAFGRAVALAISDVDPNTPPSFSLSAPQLRSALLRSSQFVTLRDLLAYAWSAGIPVAYLRIFPLDAKRMDAMSVATPQRQIVLLARETTFLARLAFIVAHELGHIALGHLRPGQTIVDEGDLTLDDASDDTEEIAANEYALEVLTGYADFRASVDTPEFNSAQLAQSALDYGVERRIDPGVVALAAGFTTGNWKGANGSLKILNSIPGAPPQVATNIPSTLNALAARELGLDRADSDGAAFLRQVIAART